MCKIMWLISLSRTQLRDEGGLGAVKGGTKGLQRNEDLDNRLQEDLLEQENRQQWV